MTECLMLGKRPMVSIQMTPAMLGQILDGDEVINLFEYQLSSDPNSAATPTIMTISAGGNVKAALDTAVNGQVNPGRRGGATTSTILPSPPKRL